MIYLDSSAFLNAFLGVGEKSKAARVLLDRVQKGEPAATSALTFDEVFWVVKKYRRFEDALLASKALLEAPNLTILPVDAEILWMAYNLIEKYKLDPRDAIHAACALMNGISTVVSDDKDFDRIKEIKRKSLVEKSGQPH